jgi:hypothetical protein
MAHSLLRVVAARTRLLLLVLVMAQLFGEKNDDVDAKP